MVMKEKLPSCLVYLVIEAAITPQTRTIVPVYYDGIACYMDMIMSIAIKHGLFICEDAAMACTSIFNQKLIGLP